MTAARFFCILAIMSSHSSSRRSLVKALAVGAAASAVGGIRSSHAEEFSKLDEKDPKARALGYVENANRVDAKKYPGFLPGSNCENCLQLQGTPGNNFRPCALFPGKLVSASGWCTGWTAEM